MSGTRVQVLAVLLATCFVAATEMRAMPQGGEPQTAEDRKLAQLVDEVLDRFMEAQPEIGTFLGYYQYDDRLGAYTAEAFEEQERFGRQVLNRLTSEIDRSQLSHAFQIDYDLLREQSETNLWLADNAEQKDWQRQPSLYFGIPTGVIYNMTLRDYAPLEERLANILKRTAQLPRVLEMGKANLKNPPRLWTETAIESAQGSIALFQFYLPMLFQQVPDLAGRYSELQPGVVQALNDYVTFMQEDLLPRSTGAWMDGAERFNYRLKHQHLMDMSAENLIAFGEELLAETETEMAALAEKIEPGRSWREIIEEAKQSHPAEGEVVAAYEQELERARSFLVEHELVSLPDGERAEIMETPLPMRNTIPYAAYNQPPVFGEGDVGIFYVTPASGIPPLTPEQVKEKLEGHNYDAIQITTAHEAYPGHHVQLVYVKNAPTSKMRKLAFSTVLVEGWGLYSEQLMYEQGYYTDDRVRLAQLKDLTWRASRVVIDASLHTGRMSFDEAVDFLVDRAALERSNAIAEVKRYTQSPTQPMSYAVGRQAILGLRAAYQEALGDEFNLREFHDELLSYGSLPPPIIEREMTDQLQQRQSGAR